jgi:hypothetical protein
MTWAGHVARTRKTKIAYKVLAGELEGKGPLGRPRCRWKDFKIDLKEIGCDVEWIHLAQDRNSVMNLRVL